MNDLRKAAERALDALEDVFGKHKVDVGAINALRAALAESEQEPFMVVAPECAERGCMAHDDRVDGAGIVVQLRKEQEEVRRLHAELERKSDALRKALAEPEQNPFGDDAERYARKLREERESYKALFTASTPRKPLTDEELEPLLDAVPFYDIGNKDLINFARAIERAHGIGEQT